MHRELRPLLDTLSTQTMEESRKTLRRHAEQRERPVHERACLWRIVVALDVELELRRNPTPPSYSVRVDDVEVGTQDPLPL